MNKALIIILFSVTLDAIGIGMLPLIIFGGSAWGRIAPDLEEN